MVTWRISWLIILYVFIIFFVTFIRSYMIILCLIRLAHTQTLIDWLTLLCDTNSSTLYSSYYHILWLFQMLFRHTLVFTLNGHMILLILIWCFSWFLWSHQLIDNYFFLISGNCYMTMCVNEGIEFRFLFLWRCATTLKHYLLKNFLKCFILMISTLFHSIFTLTST